MGQSTDYTTRKKKGIESSAGETGFPAREVSYYKSTVIMAELIESGLSELNV